MKLDVGSGGGKYGTTCLGDINIDIGRPKNKPNKPFIQCDATTLPFTENLFTQITMFDVIEHVDSPMLVLKELKRVLKANGVLVLGTPNAMRILNFLFIIVHVTYLPHKDHVYTWGKPELTNLMNKVGFKNFSVSACTYNDSKHSFLATTALKLAFRRDLKGRQLLVIAKK